MDTSKFLSKVIGLYFIIITVAMLFNMPQFTNNVTLLIHEAPLMLVTGYIALILGLLMVVSHSIWQWNWRIVITLIAWVILLKGLCIILFPHVIEETAIAFLKSSTIQYSIAYFDLGMGILLSYFGFKRDE